MNALMSKISPNATNQIRMDHTHVLAAFHQYTIDAAPRTKQGLVNTICLALEVHAQLEEELFYPALRAASADREVLDKSVPEHDEMRRLIGELRNLQPSDADYDRTVMQLMRDVIHHVADEETVLLPEAERQLGEERLDEMGAEMTKRRLQLMAPRAGEVAVNTVRAMPASTMLITAGVLVAGTYLTRRAMRMARA